MKSFHQFITEAYDKELEGQASRAPGEEGRIRAARKKREIERKRKKADKMLSKKTKKTVDPNYKVNKGTANAGTSKGTYTRQERQSLTRKGEKKLRDLRLQATGKSKESELKHAVTHKERARREKNKK